MVKKLYTESDIQNIANAIRAKNGLSRTYKVSQMAGAIQQISSAPTLPVDTRFSYSKGDLYNFLSQLDLSALSQQTQFNSMFSECTALTGVPLFDTSNGTTMSNMFLGCDALTIVPQFNTQNVTDMSNMFQSCKALTTVPQFNTQNVTDMSNMFRSCDALTTVPLFDMSNVTICNYMFEGCESLVSVPQFNTANVDDPGAMFNGCESLVDLPQLDFSSATVFGTILNAHKIFYGCTSLSNNSLNNILASMAGATSYSGTRTLRFLGLTRDQATICEGLSNFAAFTAAGWSTGY